MKNRCASSTSKTLATVLLGHISTLVGILLLEDESTYRLKNSSRPRRKFWQATSALTGIEFRRSFWMSRRVFHELIDLLKTDLRRDEDMAIRLSGSPVDAEICVAIFLRILAGASYLDMMLIFNVSRCTVYECFHRVLVHVCSKLQLDGFPVLECQRKALSKGFSSSRLQPSALHGCVGAIDGIAAKYQSLKTLSIQHIFIAEKVFMHFLFRQLLTPIIVLHISPRNVLEARMIPYHSPFHLWLDAFERVISQQDTGMLATKPMRVQRT